MIRHGARGTVLALVTHGPEGRSGGVLRYGRMEEEWDALEEAGWHFLVSQAHLQRTTSYTEMNTVLARRTGVRAFDFDLDGERKAMGELLGQISERSFRRARLLISEKLLRPRATRDEKLAFWVGHVKAVHAYPW